MLFEVSVVAALILLNGALAMSELAVVSASKVRLRVLADQGARGARTAVALAADPGRFLSTVQIGITLVGVLSGAFSGATLGERLAALLAFNGVRADLAGVVGVGSVVLVITYLSLIIGELVPKQLALRDPEAVACRIAPPMHLLSRLTAPLVWLLDSSGSLVLRLLGRSDVSVARITEEELRAIIAEGERAGVLKRGERELIAGVMRLADRTARALMTPRRDVEVLDLGQPEDALLAQLRTTRRSRLPVRDGGEDDIVGVIAVRAVLARTETEGELPDLRAFIEEAPVVMDVTGAIRLIERLRSSTLHMALVFDELGHFEGVVTALDVLEAVTGSFADQVDEEPEFTVRADGSILVSGAMPVDEFFDRLGIARPQGSFTTVAGFVLDALGHVPQNAERIERGGLAIEVVDMDGRRIDKLLVERLPAAEAG